MRAVVQRVTEASVGVVERDGSIETVGSIGAGLCVLVGVTHSDDDDVATRVADKIWNLRVFDDDAGVMNRSAADIGAAVLVVSQFTLYATRRSGGARAGSRPRSQSRRSRWSISSPPRCDRSAQRWLRAGSALTCACHW